MDIIQNVLAKYEYKYFRSALMSGKTWTSISSELICKTETNNVISPTLD